MEKTPYAYVRMLWLAGERNEAILFHKAKLRYPALTEPRLRNVIALVKFRQLKRR